MRKPSPIHLLPYHSPNLNEAGCDEAGRGCLAGPVFAAAVILDQAKPIPLLNDSKKLNAKVRSELRVLIEKNALSWSVARVDPVEIDQINILNASFKAMHRALDKLNIRPDSLLIDGNRFHPYKHIPHHCIIKGDGKYMSIAAASILAKTHRDEFMMRLHQTYPHYEWNSNKGYPTVTHRRALNRYGPSSFHRQSFRLNYEE